jgi:hypothetical protein
LNLYFDKNNTNKLKNVGFITAYNNYGIKTNDDINLKNTNILKKHIQKYNYMEAYSIYNGIIDEKGFVIFDIDYSTMDELCHLFHQNAVVYIDDKFNIIYNKKHNHV